MKCILNISWGLLIVAMPAVGQIRKGASPEGLASGHGTIVRVLDQRMTPAELRTFLAKRTSGQIVGLFHGYTSLLWALYNVGVWSEGAVADSTPLENPFPENYSPTWKELMDVLARQVDCTWHYNYDTGYWVFEKKRMKPPFTLKIAKGWNRRGEGNQVVFVPPVAPVGMDVYIMGHFSSDDPAKLQEVIATAREHVSKLFAQKLKPDVTEAEFTSEKVCGEAALHFSVPTPRDPRLKWRQWAFVKNGWCFLIVSVISEENEPRLLPDVKAMISTFEVLEGSSRARPE
jgi:hypothetical protein